MTTYVVGKRGARYQPRQILVSLAHLDLVHDVLASCGAEPGRADESEALGLARLPLGTRVSLQNATYRLLENARWEYVRVPSWTGNEDDLDPLLAALRAYFASRHGGWAPTLGKNRIVGWVGGVDGIVQHNSEPPPPKGEGAGLGTPVVTTDRFADRGAAPGRGVTVGVLDTAVAAHPWLAGGWVADPSDVLPEGREYQAQEGHATFVAGLVLSQAPGATVRVRRVLDENAQADCWDVANAIVEFGRTGLDILNLSLACYTEDGQPPLALSTAIDRLDERIVVVAAAGNHGRPRQPAGQLDEQEKEEQLQERRRPAWPAALDRVVAVGAGQHGGAKLANFTPLDADWIDLATEGTGLLSTYLAGRVTFPVGDKGPEHFNGWARWNGTSFAAALVSGHIAARTSPSRPAREALRLIHRQASAVKPRPHTATHPLWVAVDLPLAGPPHPAKPLAHTIRAALTALATLITTPFTRTRRRQRNGATFR